MTKEQVLENMLITAKDLVMTAGEALSYQSDCNHIVGTLLLATQYLEDYLKAYADNNNS